MSRSSSLLLLLGIVLILALGGIYFFFIGDRDEGQLPAPSNSALGQNQTILPEREAPAGKKEYRSEKFRFSLFYPESMKVNEFEEAGGVAMTITFEDGETLQGFQIFVVPHDDDNITEERFEADIPSGDIRGAEKIVVAGAPGFSFLSSYADLGELREVWFVKDGFLYEVSTLKPLEGLLIDILNTWVFAQ